MKAYRIFLIFLATSIVFSCEDVNNISFVDCNECTAEEPLLAFVNISLRDPYEFGPANGIVFIEIYEGNFEDKVLFQSMQTSTKEINIDLPINKKYTFSATYMIDNKAYTVINSITPRVKFNENSCDEPCYYTTPRKVNLKLKYTK